jgi:hypothetical protein
MPPEVDTATLELAAKCPFECRCLSGTRREQCVVERYVGLPTGQALLFVSCDKLGDCPYLVESGGSCTCTCPVRYELYRRRRKL